MKLRCFFVITLTILFPYAIGRCSTTWKRRVGKIICSDINQDEYLTEIFEIKTNIVDTIEEKNITKLVINIANSHFPVIDEWIYLPWDNISASISALKIVNSSVKRVKSLFKFSSLETLDLSGNNISDFHFLTYLLKLRNLHLRYSTFEKDSSLITYLQKYENRLKLIDLSYSNWNEFNLFNNIEKYDLSKNPNITLITFNQSISISYLNLSGNTQLQSIKNIKKKDFLCISGFDLSHLNTSFNFSLLNNIKISDEILLNNNNIQILNESIFALTNLISKKCSAGSDISVDLSNVNLEIISSNFFSFQIFDRVNLSNNNLGNLDGSLFSRSEFLILDISNSNVSIINPSVFNYTTVKTLNLSKNNITSLEGVFNNIESIKNLDLSFNPIQILTQDTFKKCIDLKKLSLSNTFPTLWGENILQNLPSLRNVILSFNGAINSSTIQSMYLNEVIICDSSLAYLGPENFKGFYRLSELSFYNSSVSNFSSLPFKGLNNLKTLNIKQLNKLNEDITIYKYLPNLLHLDLSHHNIKSIVSEFEGLNSLKNLNLSSNIISDLSVSSFNSLKKLNVLSLANNQLVNIPLGIFSSLRKLTHLYLNHNSLQKLLPGVFSGLDNLILLDISENQLLRSKPHVLLSNTLKSLKYLYLQNNKLGNEYAANDNTLRRYEFGLISNQASLEYIDINDNEWTCSTLIDVLESFRNKNITFRPTIPVYAKTNINGISCTA